MEEEIAELRLAVIDLAIKLENLSKAIQNHTTNLQTKADNKELTLSAEGAEATARRVRDRITK